MPRIRLRPLARQVVVLTGGTSGIGLTTARMLASRGAKLFLIARNEEALRSVIDNIRAKGGEVAFAVVDKAALDAAAAKVVEVFGGFNTWVNDAGAFIYGRLDVVPLQDKRRYSM